MNANQTANKSSKHSIGAAKLIVDDLEEARAFYEQMFDMKVATHYNYAPEVYEEYIMAFESGPRLALFAPNPNQEQPLKKSAAPQVLIFTPEFETLTQKIKSAGHKVHFLTPRDAEKIKVAVTYDPSGNVVEMYYSPGKYRVAASKLIVDNRKQAEDFYKQVFSPEVDQYLNSPTYDEVILKLGEGALLALFQPLNEDPLAKSQFPSTAIYTTDFDGVLSRLDTIGLGYRAVDTRTSGLRIIIARDPAGNAIEIISKE